MITHKLKLWAFMSAAVVGLAACGGGGTSDSGSASSSGSSTSSSSTSATAVTGKLTDANKQPIAGATLKVELAGFIGPFASTATTDVNGDWKLDFGNRPALPDTFAGVFTKAGFKPVEIIFIAKNGKVSGGVYNQATTATTEQDIEVTDGDRIIHLGDSNFSSSANSQLQVSSIGNFKNWVIETIPARRLIASYDNLCFYFLARGVQTSEGYPNYLSFANSTTVRALLSDSPTSGDFGGQRICFLTTDITPGLGLRAAFQINSGALSAGSSNYDDFEMVNFTARLEGKNSKVDTMPIIKIDTRFVFHGFNNVPVNAFFGLEGGYYPVGTVKAVWNFGDTAPTTTDVVRSDFSEFPAARSSSLFKFPSKGNFTLRVSYQDASGKELGFTSQAITVI